MQTRLVSYAIYGARGNVLPDFLQSTVTTPLGELPTGEIHYPVNGVAAAGLKSESEVAFEYWDGSAWVEPPNARFIPMGGDFDRLEEVPTQKFKLLGFGWLLRQAKVWEAGGLPIDADGKVQFLSATPGNIMNTLITKAKARGWGSGVSVDFTATQDSSGAAWPSVITLAYDLEISLEAVLNNLYQQGMVDYRWEGRTLRMFKPGTTMARERASRIPVNDGVTAAPETWTDEDRLTDTLVIGEKGVSWTFNNGATGGFGRLEKVQTQSGVSDPATAQLLAQADLIAGLDTRVSYTREFDLTAPGLYEPFNYYLPGDWVQAQRGTAFERLRVMSISVTTAPDKVTGHAVLGDRIDDILSKLAKRTSGITGGATAGGTGGRPAPSGPDTRTPSAPTALIVSSAPYINENGFPRGRIQADWSHALTATNGTTLTPDRYQLQRRINTAGTKYATVAEVESTTATVIDVPIFKADNVTPEQYAHRVRAVSDAGLVSAWSSVTVTTMQTDTTPPAAPYFVLANVTTWLRTVKVTWDGTLTTTGSNHVTVPLDFQRVDVYMDTQSSMATKVKVGELYGEQDHVMIPQAAAGTTLYFHLVAVDRSGNASTPSAVKTVTPAANVDASEILNAINAGTVTLTNVGSSALVDKAVLTSKLADNAVTQGQLAATVNADIAQGTSAYASIPGINTNISNLTTSVNGKNKIVNSTADASGTAYVAGDRWQKWSSLAAGGKLLATWRYGGTAWVQEALDPTYIPLLDIGTATFGNMDGGRIAANSLKTSSLLVSDLANFAPSPAESPGDWELVSGMTIVPSSLDAVGARFHAVDNTTLTAWARGPWMAVKAGQTLFGTTKVYRGTGTQALYLRYYWYDSTKTALGTAYTQVAWTSAGGTGTVLEGAVTVPSGAAYARYILAAGLGTGTVGFYAVDGFRQSSTVMIGAGAVTANEVNASSVAAGIGSFLTINVSQLNATSASIGTAVIDKLWTDVVQSRKIGTEMLTVTGENLIPDPYFFDDAQNTYRLSTGGTYYLGTDSASTAKILQFRDHSVGGGNIRLHTVESRIKAMPGEEYNLTMDYRYRGTTVSGATPGTIKFQLFCDAPDGTYLRTVNLTTYTRVAANGAGWLTMNEKYTIPSDVGFIRVSVAITNEISTGDVELRFPRVKRKVSADLIVDGGILTRHLTVTDDMVVALLNVHKIKAVDIDANNIVADAGTIGTLRGGILITDSVDTGMLKADSITSKHTITGAVIQTVATANSGIKLSGNYFRAYHPTTGDEVFTVSGNSGAVIGTGTWQTGTAGNYIKMYANANGGIMHLFTGSGSGRGSIWARAGTDDRMSLTYSNLDEPTGTLPVVVLTASKAYMNYGSRTIQCWNNAGTEELLLDATGASIVARGNLDMRDGRIELRYGTATHLGYVGQAPASGSSPDFEVRADAGKIRLAGLVTNLSTYSATTTAAANLVIDASGNFLRSTSARRYKTDIRDMQIPDSVLDVRVKDWYDTAAYRRRAEMDKLPRPMTENVAKDYDAILLNRVPGLIAEEVEAAGGSQFVIYGEDGQTEGIMYDRFAFAQIEVLKRQLDELRGQVNALLAA